MSALNKVRPGDLCAAEDLTADVTARTALLCERALDQAAGGFVDDAIVTREVPDDQRRGLDEVHVRVGGGCGRILGSPKLRTDAVECLEIPELPVPRARHAIVNDDHSIADRSSIGNRVRGGPALSVDE